MSDELTVPATPLPVAHGGDVLTIIQRIVDAGLTTEAVSAVEKLLNMQERIMESQRRSAFAAAMARLQADLPHILRDGRIVVKGAERSRYAKLETIDSIIRPLLAREGFALTFDTESTDGKLFKISCRITHREGHSETQTLMLPIDKSDFRSDVQNIGSTLSYARRQLMKLSLSVIEDDEDTDGMPSGVVSAEQVRDLETLIQDTNSDLGRFLLHFHISSLAEMSVRDHAAAVQLLEAKRRGTKQ